MPLDISQLEVAMAEGERWRRTLHITVPSTVVQAERTAAVRKLSSRIKLPGFRAGKVPPAVVEKRFGQAVEQEVLDRVIGEAYRGVLQERSLQPISEGEVAHVEYQPESDLKFEISFDVAPQVELARTGGFRVERPAVHVSDAQVEQVLLRLREQEGTWVPEESGSPEDGNRVSVEIRRLGDTPGEPRPYEFVLGQGQAIPDIESSIRTLSVGESGEFTIHFPEEIADEEQRGKEQRVEIELKARKRLELPEADDEFAKSVGDFTTIEELREKIHEDLGREGEREADAQVRASLVEQVLSANPFEVPDSMVDQYVRSAIGDPEDLSEDQFAEAKRQLQTRAVHAVRRHLMIDRIAETEGLAATEEEVDGRIQEIAGRSGASLSKVYGSLQKSGRLDHLQREITEGKVFDYLREQSEVTQLD